MKKVLTSRIFSLLLIIGIVVIGYTFFYKIKSPSKLEISNINYNNIDQQQFNVNEDDLNEGFFEKIEFTFNNEEVQKFKDLKDFYAGRDNPFLTLEEADRDNIINSEEIIITQQDDSQETTNEESHDIVY